MSRAALVALVALGALGVATGCGNGSPRARGFAQCTPPTGGFDLAGAIQRYGHLSDVCLVDTDASGALILHPDAVPYALTTPLFADYAEKSRAIWLPPGATIPYREDRELDLPVGAIISKTFAFGTKLLETRLLVHHASGWIAVTYTWDAAGREATLELSGAFRPSDIVDTSGMPRHANYLVPTETQCAQCHETDRVSHPIGPKVRLLNRDYDYAGGRENQLTHLVRLGKLTGAPDPSAAPRLAAWDDPSSGTVEERARAWLEVNCAHCHEEGGLARTTGLSLRASERDPARYGVCKAPVATGPASAGLQYDIVPGAPDRSILVYRIQSTTPAIMMPEIGRSLVHTEGVALVRAWIQGMQGSCP